MRLALYTDYALRTLIYLATHPGRSHVADVAKFFGISKDHVAKAVGQLSRLGYLRTTRGVGGGIELAKSAEQISVGEVVMAMEGNMHLLECVSTAGVCVIQPGCVLKGVLAEAERVQRDYLNSVKLSDVLPPSGQLVELTAASGKASADR